MKRRRAAPTGGSSRMLTARPAGDLGSYLSVKLAGREVDVAMLQFADGGCLAVVWPGGEHAGLFASWDGALGFVQRVVVVAADALM